MAATHPLESRRAALAAKLARAEAVVAAVRSDLDEIDTAIRVMQRYNLFTELVEMHREAAETAKLISEVNVNRQFTSRTPDNVPEMIFSVLRDGPMPIAGILDQIRERFAKDIDPNNVRPAAWRLWKAGRLNKLDDKYQLPESGEGLGDEPKPSVEGGDVAERSNAPASKSGGEGYSHAPVGSNPTVSASRSPHQLPLEEEY